MLLTQHDDWLENTVDCLKIKHFHRFRVSHLRHDDRYTHSLLIAAKMSLFPRIVTIRHNE
ncbi:hypothetical protein KsCSTR_28060 [Candidatus Kuenenia stuttgartiensis]|uniref:Uncharacterized protein n=1 Tax=Kuenenia stuttgartiensis TaxID=174633 RepID=A0A6G7GRP6_KUEST|nr:hypothetical protein KsCSTR_28060 [Candidatus Kuenenia stuttgartiensis]